VEGTTAGRQLWLYNNSIIRGGEEEEGKKKRRREAKKEGKRPTLLIPSS